MEQLDTEIKRKGQSIMHTYEKAKSTLSVSEQTKKNPWIMVGAAAAVGFITSEILIPRLFAKRSTIEMRAAKRTTAAPPRAPAYEAVVEDEPQSAASSNPQLHSFKSLAVGVALGTLRDLVAGAIPRTGEAFTRNLFDQATRSLGGDPIRGRIL